MKRNLFSLSFPAALVFGAGALLGGSSVADGRAAANLDLQEVVAAIDLDRARLAFPMNDRIETELRELGQSMNAELESMAARIKKLRLEIGEYDPGSEAFRDFADQIEVASFQHSQRGKRAEATFVRRQEERLGDVRFELRKQVAEFAKKKGFQLVLRSRGKISRPDRQAESYFVEDVIFAAGELDVTQAFIDYLQAGVVKKSVVPPQPDK